MRTLIAALLLLALPAPALGAENPWLERRVLHMAHQGGEVEAPSNTFYAYEKALAAGADMLEVDVNVTADRDLVVFHDTTVDNRTNGSGRVNELTVAELKALDPADDWEQYRGIALGERPPPPGFTRADFQIPTLRELLDRYPRTLVNIEIKGPAPDGPDAPSYAEQLLAGNPTAEDAAAVLAEVLAGRGRVGDTIVVSFSDQATERFKALAPEIHTAPGLRNTAAFFAARGPLPTHRAIQPPTYFQGVEVPTKAFVDDAHAQGLAVHVWLASKDEETPETYDKLIDAGVDGIMTDTPTRLERRLRERGVAWDPPKARKPCAKKKRALARAETRKQRKKRRKALRRCRAKHRAAG